MSLYLGIDTSNYTTSVALYDSESGSVVQNRRLLPVKEGAIGLRQSDAVFLHVRQLGDLLEETLAAASKPVAAVAASATPLDQEGSYMPCFLAGVLAARAVCASGKLSLHTFSHQAGHVMAALYSANQLSLVDQPFLAFHFSGGTSQCLLVEPDRERIFRIQTVAQTLDLNAGQAVDRVGGMLGLPFPAGPHLEELALRSERRPRAKPVFKGMDCCLSGLENLCAARLEKGEPGPDVARYCLEYIGATVQEMSRLALERYPGLPLVYAGGVMSNSLIRSRIQENRTGPVFFAAPQFSCDNAAGTSILCAIETEGDRFVDRYSQPD